MGTNPENFSLNPQATDFSEVVQRFVPLQEALGVTEAYQASIIQGIKTADNDLRNSFGQVILIQAHSRDISVSGVARTNGTGITISQSSAGIDQIEFGSNAIIVQDQQGLNSSIYTRRSLVIPQGFSLDLFDPRNRLRDFMIGEQEIQQKLRSGSAFQVGLIGFMLERLGIGRETFLRYYYHVSESSSASARDRTYAEIRRAIATFHQQYYNSEGMQNLQKEDIVDQSVNIFPITLKEDKILIGDTDSQLDINKIADPSVISPEQISNSVTRAISNQERPYYLTWIGSKVPRGAVINGVEIGYTEGDKVVDTAGREIGTYIRTKPDRGDEQEMIVFLKKENE